MQSTAFNTQTTKGANYHQQQRPAQISPRGHHNNNNNNNTHSHYPTSPVTSNHSYHVNVANNAASTANAVKSQNSSFGNHPSGQILGRNFSFHGGGDDSAPPNNGKPLYGGGSPSPNRRNTNASGSTAPTTTNATPLHMARASRKDPLESSTNKGDGGGGNRSRRYTQGTATVVTTNSSTPHRTGGARSVTNANTHKEEEANVDELNGDGDDDSADPLKPKKNKCTISLVLIFAGECLLIAAAFIAIIVYSNVQVNATANDLINNGITASLQYAATEVSSPFVALEDLIIEYRARYHSAGVIAGGLYYPCDDRTARTADRTNQSLTFQPSASFFSDTYLAVQSIPRLLSVSSISMTRTINWDLVLDYDDFKNNISQCSVNSNSIYRRYNNRSITTSRTPEKSEYADLDQIPLNLNNDTAARSDGHEGNYLVLALSATRVTSTPMYEPATGRYMLYVSPLIYTYVNATTGRTIRNFQADVRLATIIGRPDVLSYTITAGLTFTYSMDDLYDTLLAVTPAYPDAHTSLYDLVNQRLLASTRLPRDEQFNVANGSFYLLGESASTRVNLAFFESDVIHQPIGNVWVDYDDNHDNAIVSSFVFETTGSNAVYAIVQSTPREFYFDEVSRLQNVMIALGVVCCVLVIALCIGVAIAIRDGIGQLLANMALAAHMKNDRTTYITTFLYDVDRLAKGFGKMNDRLLEARAYLPQHMLLTTSSDDSAMDDDEGSLGPDGHRNSGGTNADVGDGMSTTIRSHQRTITSNHSTSPSNSNNNNINGAPRKPARRNIQNNNKAQQEEALQQQVRIGKTAPVAGAQILAMKRVTILAVNVRHFHKMVNVAAPSTIPPAANEITEAVASAAHHHKGVIDAFHGDHFVIGFNAVRNNAEGPTKAARCALDVMGVVAARQVFAAMGISSGRACVGHLGTATLKRLSIIGAVYSKAMALERLCRRFNPRYGTPMPIVHNNNNNADDDEAPLLPVQCLVDTTMAAEVQHQYLLQLLGGVYGAPFAAAPPNAAVAAAHAALVAFQQQLAPIGSPHSAAGAGGGAFSSSDALGGGSPKSTPNVGHSHHPNTLHRSGHNNYNSSSSSAQCELFYALRCPTAANTGGDDEWLYELTNDRAGLFNDVNAALEAYLKALPTTSLAPYTSPLVTACLAATASASNANNSSAATDSLLAAQQQRYANARSDLSRDLAIIRTQMRQAKSNDDAGGNNKPIVRTFDDEDDDGSSASQRNAREQLLDESFRYAALIAAGGAMVGGGAMSTGGGSADAAIALAVATCARGRGGGVPGSAFALTSPVKAFDASTSSALAEALSIADVDIELLRDVAEEEAKLFGAEPPGAPRGCFYASA